MTTSRLLVVLLFLCAALSSAGDAKRKPAKPPELVITEAVMRRSDGRLTMDGRVRNDSGKPLEGVVLLFAFRTTDGQTVATKRGPLDEALLDLEGEAEFHMEVPDVARAVTISLEAVDRREREIKVGKPGPYAIE